MKRTITILTTCAFLAGCPSVPINTATNNGSGTDPNEPRTDFCTKSANPKIKIEYGDSWIKVKHKVNVKQKDFITLVFKPENKAPYKNLDVYLFGASTDAEWLNGVYNAGGSDEKNFDVCVEAEPGEYKYMVVVPGVGTIDPRIIVDVPPGG